ncbi:hypothetical protein RVS70_05580 [Virgibacillus sp. M23]|uniref:hypothetical protein n=1 Tax=Virgibacillus sp. M23 TaxID=3079030 RepID=UPI002A9114C5|nr:hypothetical protein [Virgibacillus sp. M23]MDY7043673.1 hypothetical protein [Virgibacillus sp. M23]
MRSFNGTLAKHKLSDFNKYDNKLKTLQERLEFVEENLYYEESLNDFFAIYFNSYYNVSPNQNGYLAEEDAVCRLLDNLGTYIMKANDVESNRKVKYRFWVNEKEYRDYKESENKVVSSKEGSDVEVIDMFVNNKKDKNQKIVKGITIHKKDLKDIEEIRSLQNAIDYLCSKQGKNEVRKKSQCLQDLKLEEKDKLRAEYIAKNTDNYIKSYVKNLKENQISIKEIVRRPITFKSIMRGDGAQNKLDAVDLLDKKHVKSLLELISYANLNTDAGMILSTVTDVLNSMDLKKRELDIIERFKKGSDRKETMKELNISRSNMNNVLNRIAVKFVSEYERQLEEIRKATGIYSI